MFKSNKGFTLVELIVVIAILAILAGVAIPVYNGYIKRANDAAVVTELDAIQTAAQAANATCGQIEIIVVDGTTIKVGGVGNKLASGFNSDFCLFYPDGSTTADAKLGVITAAVELKGSYESGATWKNGKWEAGATDTVADQTAGTIGGGTVTGGTEQPKPETTKCNHENYEAEEPVPATCTEAGYTKYVCKEDGCSGYYIVTGDAKLNHVDNDPKDQFCDRCKEELPANWNAGEF